MNIFIRELKANRKALIIWSVCMVLLVVSGMAKYTAYSSGGSGSEVLNKMPFTLKALLGIGSFDVASMGGFFGFLFLYIEVTIAIHAVLLGNGIIAKEERDKTTEFLIVKPVSRSTIITSKLLAALLNIVILNLITLVSSIAMVGVYNKGNSINGEIFTFFLSMFIIQLLFLTLGALLSAFMRKAKVSGSVATSILLFSFVISKITDLTDRMNFLNVLSPFKYFSYADIVNGNGLNFVIVILTLIMVAIFSVLTYFFYNKRDLSV
ncbi:ABC transporter permease subunit [Clostridium sp. YIM B02505]|uniref:ABC transporter permease subunit n=1 Tax=Clostridium yunnanense TaxID=2800325 RepID=A0ABS1ESG9_9CLOT|nr:ABC transporter permease subunit [Clostridium yunnanense]MBK1812341.1 ABC transporter permease subunit [Clostridium yunnanense]